MYFVGAEMLVIVFDRLFAAVTRNTVVLTATRVTRAQPRARQRSRSPLPTQYRGPRKYQVRDCSDMLEDLTESSAVIVGL